MNEVQATNKKKVLPWKAKHSKSQQTARKIPDQRLLFTTIKANASVWIWKISHRKNTTKK